MIQGNRFFTRRTIGAELIIFHLMEIVGAIVCGRFLDREDPTSGDTHRRKRAIACLLAFVVINSTGNVLAAMQENAATQNTTTSLAHDISDPSVISPSLAFACWGFADAQIQVYCYWLMGSFYSSGSEHSRAVGWYKCIQSLGSEYDDCSFGRKEIWPFIVWFLVVSFLSARLACSRLTEIIYILLIHNLLQPLLVFI
mmetsp:Transcript_33704/g.61945  ORF Transcript_33704/g.61945 Transcript_33704/m.61945 type:complete len:198 (-) Transcript_33704:1338-1931(-)